MGHHIDDYHHQTSFLAAYSKGFESQKRMQKISAPMKEIQAKYKDKASEDAARSPKAVQRK